MALRWTLALTLLLPLVLSGCAAMTLDTAAKGRRDAKRDFSAGRKVYKLLHGRPAPWRGDFIDILKREYSIESELVVDDREYAKAYNAIAEAEFARIFGVDVIESASQQSQANFRKLPQSLDELQASDEPSDAPKDRASRIDNGKPTPGPR